METIGNPTVVEPRKDIPHQDSNPPRTDVESSAFRRFINAIIYEPGIHGGGGVYFFKHRYFRGVAYLFICLCTTLVYYGWQPFQVMLFRSGAYRWRCTPDEIAGFETPDDTCVLQYDAVQALYNVGLSSEFILGVVAGVCIDHVGPLLTAIIGNAMFVCGWMCLLYSTQSVQAYIPGMILLSGSVNMIAFPCLGLGELFPQRAGFAVSLIVAAQTAGTFVAPVMKAIWDGNPGWGFHEIVWGYIFLIVIPCFILSILCHPVRRFAFLVQEVKPEAVEEGMERPAATDIEKLGENVKEVDSNDPTDVVVTSGAGTAAPAESGWTSFLAQARSIEYIMFTLYYVAQLFQYGYYPTTVLREYGSAVSDFQGYILPSQGLFGALFGLLVDKTGTLFICGILIIMMTGAYVLALIPSSGVQYLTSLLFVVSNSYIYTVKYTFVAELFPPLHFGVLIGLIGCIAGALTLLNIPIQNTNQYTLTCVAYICVGGVAFLIIGWLHFRLKKRKGVAAESDSPQSKTNSEAGA